MGSFYGFVDGAYLRMEAIKHSGHEFLDPRAVVLEAASGEGYWPLERTLYYDAIPDPSPDGVQSKADEVRLEKYFAAVEALPDTECRFGYVRGRPDGKRRRQKAVDILLAVDLLTRAHARLFGSVVLVAGDGDFAPLVHEVKRHGVMVLVAGFEGSVSDLLTTEADRFKQLSFGDRYKLNLETTE